MMRVTILDNGLRSKFEHSYAINKAIGDRFSQLGIPYQIFGTCNVEADVRAETGCVPFFRRGVYDQVRPSRMERRLRRIKSLITGTPEDRSPSEFRTSQILNATFEADLTSLPQDVWERDGIVLFPGLMQHQILGLARFLRSHRDAVSATFICQLMFDDTWLPWGKRSALGKKAYHNAFKIIEAQPRRVHFTTENEHVAQAYAEKFGIRTEILPIPLSVEKSNHPQSGPIRVGFFGYSKMEKGFHLLPDAIAACLNGPTELEFIVQVNHHNTQNEISEAEVALNKLPRVRVLKGQLSQEQYRAEFAMVDVALLPYDPRYFGLRGSGVFAEAASCGHVIVASKGTWAGQTIERGEAVGDVFEPYDANALAKAILRVCANFSWQRVDASRAAPVWTSRNSAKAYVDKLLSLGCERNEEPEFAKGILD